MLRGNKSDARLAFLSLDSGFCGSLPWCYSKKLHSEKWVIREGFYLSSHLSKGRCVNALRVGDEDGGNGTLLFVVFCKSCRGFLSNRSLPRGSVKRGRAFIQYQELRLCQVTLSDWGGSSVCFPPLLLCFLESLILCLVSTSPAEACLFLEVFLAATCCCSRRGFFLAFFFVSRSSVEPLLALWGHENRETWSESIKRINRTTWC